MLFFLKIGLNRVPLKPYFVNHDFPKIICDVGRFGVQQGAVTLSHLQTHPIWQNVGQSPYVSWLNQTIGHYPTKIVSPLTNNIWLVVSTPLKNISQLGYIYILIFLIYMFQTTNHLTILLFTPHSPGQALTRFLSRQTSGQRPLDLRQTGQRVRDDLGWIRVG